MSKHDKQVRRDRKKRNRARRHRAVRHPQSTLRHRTAALAGAVALAAGTSAYADPIRFDNPAGAGHFDWELAQNPDTLALSVVNDAASQPGVFAEPGAFRLSSYPGVQSAVHGQGGFPLLNLTQGQSIAGYQFLEGVSAGVTIPTPGLAFLNAPLVATNYYYAYYYAGAYTLMPEGTPTYLGVQFNLGNGTQYGWIGVIRDGFELDAFAWGYETEPGVPIAAGAPEPGSLALLAFGAAGACARRRRDPSKNMIVDN